MTPALARNAFAAIDRHAGGGERCLHATVSRFDDDGAAFRSSVTEGDVDRVNPLLGR
jgi:hypothetical protein